MTGIFHRKNGGLELPLEREDQAIVFGQDLAMVLRPGDIVTFQGELGAGKSTVVRAIIRMLLDNKELEVPSPSFSLVQEYETSNNTPIIHCDFYRLSGAEELSELGVFERISNSITLVEWPEIAHEFMPDEVVTINLRDGDSEGRIANITGRGSLIERIERSLIIRDFLSKSWPGATMRQKFTGDASARSYELVTQEPHIQELRTQDHKQRLLMNAPRLPDGPPIQNGLPYSQIAHLAEDIVPFIAIGNMLSEHGFSSPKIHNFDLEHGLILLEYMGSEEIIDNRRIPVHSRYLAAMETLAALHQCEWQNRISVTDTISHTVPDYDHAAMKIELELLVDWYIPHCGNRNPNEDDLAEFASVWDNLYNLVNKSEKSLVLRDFHSPNIIWQEEKSGIDRIGLIDFQDAMMGPVAYDVASIAQDARVDMPYELEEELLIHYIACRSTSDADFDEAAFREAYAIMAAQRATKILGIFIRLDKRDGKPAYLQHLPRMRDYLFRNLKHEVLKDYAGWLSRLGVVEQ